MSDARRSPRPWVLFEENMSWDRYGTCPKDSRGQLRTAVTGDGGLTRVFSGVKDGKKGCFPAKSWPAPGSCLSSRLGLLHCWAWAPPPHHLWASESGPGMKRLLMARGGKGSVCLPESFAGTRRMSHQFGHFRCPGGRGHLTIAHVAAQGHMGSEVSEDEWSVSTRCPPGS